MPNYALPSIPVPQPHQGSTLYRAAFTLPIRRASRPRTPGLWLRFSDHLEEKVKSIFHIKIEYYQSRDEEECCEDDRKNLHFVESVNILTLFWWKWGLLYTAYMCSTAQAQKNWMSAEIHWLILTYPLIFDEILNIPLEKLWLDRKKSSLTIESQW